MPKPDYKHDYYADLELRPNATVDDIKKSFKKLARLYHPDRNPGKQDEYVPKFQAIQAAHEILTDPDLRTKYDSDRRKYGASSQFPRPPQPPGAMHNMYRATSSFAPPPRRSATQTPRPDPYASADRYFGRPPTAQKPATPARDPPNNLNEAWRHVRPQRPAPPPRPQPQAQSAAYSDNESAYQRRERTSGAYDYSTFANARPAGPAFTRSNTVRVPKKGGYDPNARDDEGQARATSGYSSSTRASYHAGTAPPEAPDPPSAQQKFQTPPKSNFAPHSKTAEDVPFFEGNERIRTPYGGPANGENSYFTSADLRREASRQARTRSHERSERKPTSPPSGNRHRSMSPGPRKQQPEASSPLRPPPAKATGGNARRPFAARTSGGAVSDDSDEETVFNGRTNFRTTRQQQTPPIDRQGNAATPFSTNGEAAEPQNMYDDTLFSPFTPPPRSFSDQLPAPFSNSTKRHTMSFRRSSVASAAGVYRSKAAAAAQQTKIPNWAYPSSVPPPSKSQSIPPGYVIPDGVRSSPRVSQRPPSLERASTSPSQASRRMSTSGFVQVESSRRPSIVETRAAPLSGTFSFNGRPPPPPPATNPQFKSKSDESLRQSFTPGNFDDLAQQGSSYFDAPVPANTGAARKRTPGPPRATSKPPDTRQRAGFVPTAGLNGVQFGVPGGPKFPPPPPGPPPNLTSKNAAPGVSQTWQFPPPETPGGVKFSQDDWHGAFQPQVFAAPPPPTSPPKRGVTPARKTRSATRTAGDVPKAFATEVEDEERGAQPSSAGGSDTGYDGDAMDIDDELSASVHSFNSRYGKEARAVPLQPNRADWRDVAEGPANPISPTAATANKSASRIHSRKASLDHAVPPTTTEPNPLSDFKNVAPFAQGTTNGLDGLQKDLNSALPNNSQPSSSLPLASDYDEPVALDLPQPPLAPEFPPGTKLTTETWTRHCQLMSVYFAKWARFHSDILARFVRRNEQMKALVGTNWLSAGGGAGFDRYMIGMRQDVVVREWWETAQEKHFGVMEAFERLRERVVVRGVRSEV